MTVVGTGFRATDKARVRFDGTVVAASVGSSTQLSCITPAHSPGNVSVEVSNNDLDYTLNYVQFTYDYAVDVQVLLPTSGPTSGGTVVTVTATELLSIATCRFGTLAAAGATVLSSTVVKCESPAQSAGVTNVEVTNNGQDYTLLTRQFVYYGTLGF